MQDHQPHEGMMKSLLQLLHSLLRDIKRLLPEAQGLDRDYVTIAHRVEHEGDSFLAITFPTICDSLDRGLADGRFTCPTSFKKGKSGALPLLLRGLLCEVFDDSGSLRPAPNLEYIKCIRELTRAFKKLDLSEKHQAKLDVIAKEKFLKDDASCIDSIYAIDERRRYILSYVSRFVLQSLQNFRTDTLECKHGPGAVAEGISSNSKWKAIANHSELLERYGFDGFYISQEMQGTSGSIPQLALSGTKCKLVTVPKNTTSRRTITIEPVTKQFAQQGLNSAIRRGISKCRILSRCITLDNQGANQNLAYLGSISGIYATLDLRAASDLLSQSLVKHIFQHNPNLSDALFECRSEICILDDVEITLRKYAGMGNATTFPVQSIVFAIIAICSLLDDGQRITLRRILDASAKVRVYGDDIIVPTDCAQRTIEWLHACGLSVNTNKSFWTGKFRESCGVDAFMGIDVTPIYIRKKLTALVEDPNAIASYVATSNHYWLRCYYYTANYLAELVETSLRRKLPLVQSKSSALGWHTRLDATTISKWNGRLHRFEYVAHVLQPMYRRDKLSGLPALLKYFHTGRAETTHLDPLVADVKHLERSPRRFMSKIARRSVSSY